MRHVPAQTLPRYGDRRRMRIGLLGGSFNPAHAGHLHIARVALQRLRLDQVWLLVSPGNPLKSPAGLATLEQRLASARALAAAAPRRIIATDVERHLRTRFTLDTLRALKIRFPRVRFVWLMGADNLTQFPRWRGWTAIARAVPFAVLPRPPYTHAALASRAAQRLARARRAARQGPVLADLPAPAWIFLAAREHALSATAIRAAEAGENRSPESQHRPPPPAPTSPSVAPPNLPPR